MTRILVCAFGIAALTLAGGTALAGAKADELERRAERVEERRDAKGDHLEEKWDRKGDRKNAKLDRKADKAGARGKKHKAERLDAKEAERLKKPGPSLCLDAELAGLGALVEACAQCDRVVTFA